jgi:excisionase family DNA binding protein
MTRNPFGTHKDALTTGEVARICNVAARTVSKWIDTGRLEGYRIPGSKDRRVHAQALVEFMKQHNIPMGNEVDTRSCVLVVDPDRTAASTIKQVLEDMGGYDVHLAHDLVTAGLEIGRRVPDVILFDIQAGDGAAFARTVRSCAGAGSTRLVASGAAFPEDGRSLERAGFERLLRKPYAVRTLVDAIGAATNAHASV